MKKIFTIIFTALSLVSISQVDSTSFELEEASVEVYTAQNKTPVSFKNINKEFIDKINVGQEPASILSYTPSVTMTSDAGSSFGYSSFRIRGIDQTRINVTMDGIPLNEPEDQGVYFNNYPDFFNSANSVQIQRGVGTSNNGISAFGGSIPIESANMFDSRKIESGFSYGSFGTGRIYAEYNSGKSKSGFAGYVRASIINTEGYIDNAYHFGKSIFYGLGKKWNYNTLKFVGFLGNQKNGMAWLGSTQGMLDESPTTNGNNENEEDDFTNNLTSLQFSRVKGKTKVNATAYFNFLEGNYDVDLNNFGIEAIQNIGLVHNYYGGFVNATHYLEEFKISYGIHASKFNRKHNGVFTVSDWNYVNTGFRNTLSGFVKMNYDIGNLNLFADVQKRATNFIYEGNQEMPEQSWSFLNYRGGTSYTYNSYILYYSYGQTSREPTRNDLFLGNDNLDLSLYSNGVFSEINPETVQDHEFGIKVYKDRLKGQLNGYLMSFDNEITLLGQVGPNGLQLSGNVESSYRTGIELDLDYKLSQKINIYHNSNVSKNKIKQSGEEFSHVLTPNFVSNSKVSYSLKKIQFAVQYRHQGESFLNLENTVKIGAFNLIDLSAVYSADKNIDISLFLNNLFNESYNASGYTVNYGDGGSFVDEVRYFRQAGFNFQVLIVVRI